MRNHDQSTLQRMVVQNIRSGQTHDPDPLPGKPGVTPPVVMHLARTIVMRAIDFDGESS